MFDVTVVKDSPVSFGKEFLRTSERASERASERTNERTNRQPILRDSVATIAHTFNRQPILRDSVTTITHTFKALPYFTNFFLFCLKNACKFHESDDVIVPPELETLKVHILSLFMQLFNGL